MTTLTDLACPHCGRETPVAQQRCTQCGLTMLGDRAFARLQAEVLPLAQQIEAVADSPAAMRPLLKQLNQATASWPELRPWYEAMAKQMPAMDPAPTAMASTVRRVHWLILAFFALVALGAGLYTRDWSLALILALPVGGWYWLGIHRLGA
jgi:hypothetical protein